MLRRFLGGMLTLLLSFFLRGLGVGVWGGGWGGRARRQNRQATAFSTLPGVGKNEFYPCIPDDLDFGVTIAGNASEVAPPWPLAGSSPAAVVTVPLSLAVDRFNEPDLRASPSQPAAAMRATVTDTHPNATLVVGRWYQLYRFDGYRTLPATKAGWSTGNYTSRHPFVGTAPTYVFEDPLAVLSSGTMHYRCAELRA